MTHNYQNLKEEVFSLLRNDLPEVYTYHSFEHTSSMLGIIDQYLEPYDSSLHEKELLSIAILYHDLGFIEGYNDHEKKGVQMAEKAMQKQGYNTDDIDLVKELIIATRMPQEPNNNLEKIICDIDLDYLGRDDYFDRSELLFQEWLALGLVKDRAEWEQKELAFLQNHHFHSEFGIVNRQPTLNQHLETIKSR